jgi:pimeloyl-ACP methyl ester carboxylesterase
VDDRQPDLILEVHRVGKVVLEGQPEEGDLVGRRDEVVGSLGPWDALVQAVQAVGVTELVSGRLVLDDDRDFAEGGVERRRDPREGALDEAFEALAPGRTWPAVTAAAASDGHGPPILALVDVPAATSSPAADPAAEPEGFVVVVPPNDRIHFLDWGGASRPGVLLVHGLVNTSWSWAPVCRRLVPVRRTVAMDLRGHGLSDAPTEAYDRATLVEDAIAVAEGAGLLPAPIVLAGHGFGAIVAAWTAAALGDGCAGLVLVDGGWEDLRASTGLTPEEFVPTLDEPPEVLGSMEAFLADRRAFDPDTWDADQERAARASVVELPAGRVVPASRPHAIAGAVGAMFEYRPLEVLREVTAPISILAAAEDETRSRGPALDRLLAALDAEGRRPLAPIRFPSDGHNLPRYRAADVAAAILGVAADVTA